MAKTETEPELRLVFCLNLIFNSYIRKETVSSTKSMEQQAC